MGGTTKNPQATAKSPTVRWHSTAPEIFQLHKAFKSLDGSLALEGWDYAVRSGTG
jgi:hypothetical protein